MAPNSKNESLKRKTFILMKTCLLFYRNSGGFATNNFIFTAEILRKGRTQKSKIHKNRIFVYFEQGEI